MTTSEVAPEAVESTPRMLLRERNFRRYFTAGAVSIVGDQITLLALPLLAALALDATPAQMGYLTAAGLAPSLLFSLYAGVWVDRRASRRRVMVAADLARAALIVTIPIAALLDQLTVTQLYLVAFGVGTFSVLFELSNATLFVSLVPREGFIAANSLINGSRAFSTVVGPAGAGALVQVLTAPIALVVDAMSYVVSALLLGRTRATEPPPETATGGQLATGFRFLRQSAAMRAILLGAATLNLFNFIFQALFILYATRHLGVSAGLLGAVLGAAAVGAVLGSVVTARLTRRFGLGPVMIAGLVLFTLPLALVPAAAGPMPLVLALLFTAEFVAGIGVMMLDISAGALMAALVPDRLRARVAGAFRTVNYGIRPVGALLGGALGTAIGVRPALWIATIGGLAGLFWLIGSPIPGMRTLPETDELD